MYIGRKENEEKLLFDDKSIKNNGKWSDEDDNDGIKMALHCLPPFYLFFVVIQEDTQSYK